MSGYLVGLLNKKIQIPQLLQNWFVSIEKNWIKKEKKFHEETLIQIPLRSTNGNFQNPVSPIQIHNFFPGLFFSFLSRFRILCFPGKRESNKIIPAIKWRAIKILDTANTRPNVSLCYSLKIHRSANLIIVQKPGPTNFGILKLGKVRSGMLTAVVSSLIPKCAEVSRDSPYQPD